MIATATQSAATVRRPVGAGLANPMLPKSAVKDKISFALPQGTLWGRTSDAAAGKVRLSHVDQGWLNDCFFASVMGAMALKRPNDIDQMLGRRGDRIVVEMPDRRLVMDRELPTMDGKPAYASSGTNKVLWPAYLEKAYALQRRGGYAALDRGGTIPQAFEWFTGSTPRRSQTPEQIVPDISQRLRAGEPVVVATRNTTTVSPTGRALKHAGLFANHCYVATATPSVDGALRLRLWNPWGFDQPRMTLSEDQVRRLLDEVTTDRATYPIPRPS